MTHSFRSRICPSDPRGTSHVPPTLSISRLSDPRSAFLHSKLGARTLGSIIFLCNGIVLRIINVIFAVPKSSLGSESRKLKIHIEIVIGF